MIRTASVADSRTVAELALRMWDGHTVDELTADFARIIGSDTAVCFIKYIDGTPIGFAQCGLRSDYVEDTESSPVGYLEGIFVKENYRNKGYAKELLCACEEWAKRMGCREFASDCELDNTNSLKFHLAMGFEETNRIICFKKEL